MTPPDSGSPAAGPRAWGALAPPSPPPSLAEPVPDERRIAAARREVAAAFAADGPLAAAFPGFTPRSAQSEMALAVFDAICDRATLVAEAGTGTGKTFAYLVPGLLAGGKLLVSAGTKALQDQIFGKDLAAVRAALGLDIDLALLKGRQNYVCLHRMARAEVDGTFASRDDARYLREVVRFALTSDTGDRMELASVPESASLWPSVTSTRDNCLGAECPRFDDCFVYKARRRAQQADVVVVNHHLFLADLALRDDAISEFLPDVDTVVIDEAHQLPKIAAEFFGEGWSLAQVADLARDVRALGLSRAADGADWAQRYQAVENAARDLRLRLQQVGVAPGTRLALDRLAEPAYIGAAVAALADQIAALAQAVEQNDGRDPELDLTLPRAKQAAARVRRWADVLVAPPDERVRVTRARAGAHGEAGPGDAALQDDADATVRWIAASQHGAQFQETPLAPGAALARARENRPQTWILASATLTVAGRFDEFLAEAGLPDAQTRCWDSPFDYPSQGLLYLPARMPSPLAGDFPERVADAVWPVLAASGGRAFVLCTTLRAVDRVAAQLRRLMARDDLELPLFVQGTSTRRALLDAFRVSGNGVLVGSVSFWEGIDVRGDALSVVAIDKLPFAPPDDPVVEAKIRRMRAAGLNPFMSYQLPQAITLLRQGAGRLIRDENDRGVLVLLDDRVTGKPYGRTVLASLPPMRRTRDVADVQAFFEGVGRDRGG